MRLLLRMFDCQTCKHVGGESFPLDPGGDVIQIRFLDRKTFISVHHVEKNEEDVIQEGHFTDRFPHRLPWNCMCNRR